MENKITQLEKDILNSTKEFAKVNNIHYDKMTENMILNAIREGKKQNLYKINSDLTEIIHYNFNSLSPKIIEKLNAIRLSMSEHFPKEEEKQPIKEEETRYWECVEGDLTYFTKGKIYCLVEGKNIESLGAFIDNEGANNGFYPYNKDYFKPSTKEAYDKQEGKGITSENQTGVSNSSDSIFKKPFEITYKEGQTTTFGGVKYTLGHGKWIREESKPLEERVSEKRETFEKALEPVMKWLSENNNPHAKIIIENNSAELVEGVMIFNSLNK